MKRRRAGQQERTTRRFPDSDYQWWIFYEDEGKETAKPLPPRTEFDLLFGFRKRGSSDVSDDGIVSVNSALRIEAQKQARSIRGYDEGHVAILRNPDVAERVNQILAERF